MNTCLPVSCRLHDYTRMFIMGKEFALNSLIDLFAFDNLVGSWAQACLYLNILLTVLSIFFQS